ncbi:MAG TPA: hypothetical protein PLQ95_04410 [Thiobacillus sp.]|nr:hypothetical protein [Thiobacillus sp.]
MITKTILNICLVGAVAGCATNVTMTGKAYPPVPVTNVKVLFTDKPKCDYEELGFIGTPAMWNQNAAVQSAREKAAEIGADYLLIQNVSVNMYNDAMVSGMAYKCGKVDREKVEISPPSAK